MDRSTDITHDGLKKLLNHVVKNNYKARDTDIAGETILNNCLRLFSKDYKFSVVNNNQGELCSHYPTKIVLLEYAQTSGRSKEKETSVESLHDLSTIKELFNKAKYARCRGRFPVPVILFEDKHICRGATISGGVEIYGRSGLDFFFTRGENIPEEELNNDAGAGNNEWQLFNRIRGQDIKVLKNFNINYICDLMVEKKKVKFGMNVTSSEKVDKENRYSDFTIISLPYPGCEFFRDWRDNGYRAEDMVFDWNQSYVDARLDLPPELPPLNVDWKRYRSWDLVHLSQNYLRLLLHYISEGSGGLLVHCISGWDRTPLFVSLLRLSLWADGVIHQSLGPIDILYLTIAYDWFLFGHNFPDRISKGEDIFFFCFNCLKYITGEEFNITALRKPKCRTSSRTDSDTGYEGVLLDNDFAQVHAVRSDSSLSNSSLNSSRSSMEVPASMNHIRPEDSSVANGLILSVGSLPHHTSVSARFHNDHSSTRSSNGHTSSPMSVPKPHSTSGHSASCGSWQIISGNGSLRGSTPSTPGLMNQPPLMEESIEEAEMAEVLATSVEESVRKQRLDAVRRIFLEIYSSMMDFSISPEPNGSGNMLSGLFDQFAEKVGIKSGKNSSI